MTRSTAEIAFQEFTIVRKGFDPAEVRAYLTAIADGLEAGAVDAATIRSVQVLDAAEAEARRRRLEADAHVDAALQKANRLEGGSSTSTMAGDDPAPSGVPAWQHTGDAVARVLAAAHREATDLIASAEAVATGIRGELQAEAAQTRIAAEQEAEEIVARARAEAESQRTSVESERAEALVAIERARADAAQIESAARARAIELVAEAQAQIDGGLAQARADLGRIDAARREASARLQRVRTLVDRAIAVTGDGPPPGGPAELSGPRPSSAVAGDAPRA